MAQDLTTRMRVSANQAGSEGQDEGEFKAIENPLKASLAKFLYCAVSQVIK
jgi:hypothetical protein